MIKVGIGWCTEEQRKERLRIRREKKRKTKRISACLFSKDCSGVMKMSWRDWRQLPDRSGDGRKKKNKSGEDGSH